MLFYENIHIPAWKFTFLSKFIDFYRFLPLFIDFIDPVKFIEKYAGFCVFFTSRLKFYRPQSLA